MRSVGRSRCQVITLPVCVGVACGKGCCVTSPASATSFLRPAQLDPDFESGGLDEAYLDVTGYCTRTATSGEEVGGGRDFANTWACMLLLGVIL